MNIKVINHSQFVGTKSYIAGTRFRLTQKMVMKISFFAHILQYKILTLEDLYDFDSVHEVKRLSFFNLHGTAILLR